MRVASAEPGLRFFRGCGYESQVQGGIVAQGALQPGACTRQIVQSLFGAEGLGDAYDERFFGIESGQRSVKIQRIDVCAEAKIYSRRRGIFERVSDEAWPEIGSADSNMNDGGEPFAISGRLLAGTHVAGELQRRQ